MGGKQRYNGHTELQQNSRQHRNGLFVYLHCVVDKIEFDSVCSLFMLICLLDDLRHLKVGTFSVHQFWVRNLMSSG